MSRNAEKFRSLLQAIEDDDRKGMEAILASVKNPTIYADARPREDSPPLEIAIRRGHASLLEPLVNAGARLRTGGHAEDCSLKLAAESGTPEVVTELLSLESADFWSQEERVAAVEAATERNRPEILQILTTRGLPEAELAGIVCYAAMCGHASALAELLRQGVDPNTRQRGGDGSLAALHRAACGGMAAVAAVLLRGGADANIRDARGRTPLMHAVEGEPRQIAFAAAEAVSKEQARAEGRLIWSAAPPDPPRTQEADTAFAVLLESGADATICDEDGNDALALLQQTHKRASERGGAEWPLPKLRREATGGDIRRLAEEVESQKVSDHEALDAETDRIHADVVATFAAELRRAGATGRPPSDEALAAAVEAGDAEAASEALAEGASVSARILIQNGYASTTPLGFAAGQDRQDLVRLLLNAGADPDAGEGERTPLARAAHLGRLEMIKLLLDAGANPNGRPGDDPDNAPLIWAGYMEQRAAIDLLKESGATPAEKDQAFKPGVDLGNALTEMVVKADGGAVAAAVAKHLDGELLADAIDTDVVAAENAGAMVVQLDGSAWSSVLPHTGFVRYPDDRWTGLASAVSTSLGVPAVLVCYEDVSGSHGYWMYEGGEEVEAYEQDLEDPDLGDSGRWETRRGTPPPADMTRGVATIQALAERESFATFESNPGGTPGQPFLFSFPGDRRPLLGGWYVRA